MTFQPLEPQTAASFDRWALAAHPGNRIEYYRGHIARDRYDRDVSLLARMALDHETAGNVYLFQVREGAHDYRCVAVRRGRAE